MAEEEYTMAIGQRTTSSRVAILDKKRNKIGSSRKGFTQYFPNTGWVEHSANETWNSVRSVITGFLIESGVEPTDIVGIGITNQQETTVVRDKMIGLPTYNATVWQSCQTTPAAGQLKEDGYNEVVRERTGLIIDACFSAMKVRWILDHVEGAQEHTGNGELMLGTTDAWLIWKLTRDTHVTGYSNVSRTMLFNIHDLDWDQEILDLLNVPQVMLLKVVSDSEVYGLTENCYFYGSEVPIAGMVGDQQAALFGQMAFEPGVVKNIYGAGSFIVMNTSEESRLSENDLLTIIGYGVNGKVYYALEGSIFMASPAI